jgi:hypothetical protein
VAALKLPEEAAPLPVLPVVPCLSKVEVALPAAVVTFRSPLPMLAQVDVCQLCQEHHQPEILVDPYRSQLVHHALAKLVPCHCQ